MSRAVMLTLALAGCAAAGPIASSDENRLQRWLDRRTAGAPANCVPVMSGRSLTIVDSSTLVYDAGTTIWVNRLDSPCPGLDDRDTLVVDLHGSQYCRGDLVRGVTPGMSIAGPKCPLGDFVPYRRLP